MFDDLTDLYQQVILDHSKRPRNYRKIEGADRTAEGHNPLCGDHVTMFMNLEGDTIKDISFLGDGCAIYRASASLLTEALKGKRKEEVKTLFDKVHGMVVTGAVDGDVGKLAAFAGVHKFPARVKCAILPWHAAMAAVEGSTTPVTTEQEDLSGSHDH
jgi:nitrogen fixation NifU-like protein